MARETHSVTCVYQGSPLFPIFRELTNSLYRHSYVAQAHLHTIHPAQPLSPSYPPMLTSAINTLVIRYSSIFPHANPIHSFHTPRSWYKSVQSRLNRESILQLQHAYAATHGITDGKLGYDKIMNWIFVLY